MAIGVRFRCSQRRAEENMLGSAAQVRSGRVESSQKVMDQQFGDMYEISRVPVSSERDADSKSQAQQTEHVAQRLQGRCNGKSRWWLRLELNCVWFNVCSVPRFCSAPRGTGVSNWRLRQGVNGTSKEYAAGTGTLAADSASKAVDTGTGQVSLGTRAVRQGPPISIPGACWVYARTNEDALVACVILRY